MLRKHTALHQDAESFDYLHGNCNGKLSEHIRAIAVTDIDNYWVTSDLSLQSDDVKLYHRYGHLIEEFPAILMPELRLEGYSARDSIAQISHFYCVLIAFCQLGVFHLDRKIEVIRIIRSVFFDCIIPTTFHWIPQITRNTLLSPGINKQICIFFNHGNLAKSVNYRSMKFLSI